MSFRVQRIFLIIFISCLPIFITRFSVGNFSDTETSISNGLVAGTFVTSPSPTIIGSPTITPTATQPESPTPTQTITPSPTPIPTIELPLVINEVYADGVSANEWIELYNPNNFSVVISGWAISDGTSNDTIPLNNSIPANSFFVLLPSGTVNSNSVPQGIGKVTFSNALGDGGFLDTGEKIILRKPDTSVSDQLSYGSDTTIFTLPTPAPSKTHSRIPNGNDTNSSSDWVISNNPTIGTINQP